MKPGSVRVVPAHRGESLDAARALILEYAGSLGFDLGFQGFDQEMEHLPGDYAPPMGCLLVAYVDEFPAGCVAVRRLDGDACEMKRLYVRATSRGLGVGRALATAAMEEARVHGYRIMRLDTTAAMVTARALYGSLGFHATAPYRHNPLPGAVFMECRL